MAVSVILVSLISAESGRLGWVSQNEDACLLHHRSVCALFCFPVLCGMFVCNYTKHPQQCKVVIVEYIIGALQFCQQQKKKKKLKDGNRFFFFKVYVHRRFQLKNLRETKLSFCLPPPSGVFEWIGHHPKDLCSIGSRWDKDDMNRNRGSSEWSISRCFFEIMYINILGTNHRCWQRKKKKILLIINPVLESPAQCRWRSLLWWSIATERQREKL